MIILKIALVVGLLGFLGLFLHCMFIDWKHARGETDKSEV